VKIPEAPSLDLKETYHEEWDDDNHLGAAKCWDRLFDPWMTYVYRNLKVLERLIFVGEVN
jgi:hypothetical protein